jgi:hypothetical protein
MRRTLVTVSVAAWLQLAQSYGDVLVGPGPNPACGGTALRIEERGGTIVRVEHTIYQSFRSVDEHYELLPDDDWQVTLLFYRSRCQLDQPLIPDRLIRKVVFRVSASGSERTILEELGFTSDHWAAEPKRLISYFRTHRSEFTLGKDLTNR